MYTKCYRQNNKHTPFHIHYPTHHTIHCLHRPAEPKARWKRLSGLNLTQQTLALASRLATECSALVDHSFTETRNSHQATDCWTLVNHSFTETRNSLYTMECMALVDHSLTETRNSLYARECLTLVDQSHSNKKQSLRHGMFGSGRQQSHSNKSFTTVDLHWSPQLDSNKKQVVIIIFNALCWSTTL